jgi:hypothetical protein
MQEVKGEPAAGLCDLDAIGGYAKPFQYGRRICRLGNGAAWAARGQAFLKPAASRMRRYGIIEPRERLFAD